MLCATVDTRSHTRYDTLMWQSKPYRTAVALQGLIEEQAPGAEHKDLAALSKSFVALEMLKLRLRMKPAPKPIDVSANQKPKSNRTKPAPAFDEGE